MDAVRGVARVPPVVEGWSVPDGEHLAPDLVTHLIRGDRFDMEVHDARELPVSGDREEGDARDRSDLLLVAGCPAQHGRHHRDLGK